MVYSKGSDGDYPYLFYYTCKKNKSVYPYILYKKNDEVYPYILKKM